MEQKKFSLSVRLTEDERSMVKRKADLAGLSMNQYVIQTALNHPIEPLAQKSKIASSMCQFYKDIEQIDDVSLRTELQKWGAQMWLFLK